MAVWELFWREIELQKANPKDKNDGSHNTTHGPLDLLPH